jgi:prepilin-type N-terminal cleavage/methylation domain-containing protein
MARKDRRELAAGFTLLELIVVLAIIMIGVLIGLPALQNMLQRTKIDAALRESAMEFRAARLEAVKQSATIFVEADFTNDKLVTWQETGSDGFTPATDRQLREFKLPKGFYFWGQGDPGAEGPAATDNLPALHQFTFLPSGAAKDVGGVRFSDGMGNFFEVHVEPKATARVTLRKWDGAAWKQQGEGGQRWTWS